jgi:HSP20 family molecular chaperone IbpA
MLFKKKSFFERLTGGARMDDDDEEVHELKPKSANGKDKEPSWMEEDAEEGQLTVDVYQTPSEIIVQTMVAGVRPEDLNIAITRDMITIKGKREENRAISEDNYFTKELYWGSFSRTILLPQEIEPEEAEAIEKHGLLIIKLPKIDKEKKTNLRIKSL